MCADSASYAGNVIVGVTEKITRAPDGTIGAATGLASACAKFRDWLLGGMLTRFSTGAPTDEFHGIMVRPDGTVQFIESDGYLYSLESPFHAIGYGRDMMIGAMAANASPYQAVAIVGGYSGYARGKIQTVYLDPTKWRLPLTFDQVCDAFKAGFTHEPVAAILLPDNVPVQNDEPSPEHPVVGNTADIMPGVSADNLLQAAVRFGAEAREVLANWRQQHPNGLYYHPACLGDPGTRCGPVNAEGCFQRDVEGVRLTALVPPPPGAPDGAVVSLAWCLGIFPVQSMN